MQNSLLGGEACGDSFSRCARSLTVLELDTEYYTTPVFFDYRRHLCGEKSTIACFRPLFLTNVRKGKTYRFHWIGKDVPVAIDQLKQP